VDGTARNVTVEPVYYYINKETNGTRYQIMRELIVECVTAFKAWVRDGERAAVYLVALAP
jgi:hypothetical protein